MLQAYRAHVAERAALGIPPLPLSKKQTAELIELLLNPPKGEESTLVDLITYRVPAGVDDAAEAKAAFLAKVAKGEAACALISREKATELLGTMLGGYNVQPLIDLLDDAKVGTIAAKGLSGTLLVFDAFHDVKERAEKGNANAKAVMQSWAEGEWFTSRPEVPQSLTVTVFKVTGETNTDDLSPAPDAWSRPDIPLHALAMLKNPRAGIEADKAGERGPIKQLDALKAKGNLVAYVGDVVGTGSSRKSATNSRAVVHRRGHSLRSEQAFRRRLPRHQDRPDLLQHHGRRRRVADRTRRVEDGHGRRHRTARATTARRLKNGEVIAEFKLKTDVILDEVRAGGRIPLIIGRGLTDKAREALGLGPSPLFRLPSCTERYGQGLLAGAEDGRPRLRPA